MPIPTDFGRVVITDEPDGTSTVIVCTDIVGGEPVNAFAMHVCTSSIDVDYAVQFDAQVNNGRGTTQSVSVSSDDDGTVRVTSVPGGSPLLSER
jgi:hypothetical protein